MGWGISCPIICFSCSCSWSSSSFRSHILRKPFLRNVYVSNWRTVAPVLKILWNSVLFRRWRGILGSKGDSSRFGWTCCSKVNTSFCFCIWKYNIFCCPERFDTRSCSSWRSSCFCCTRSSSSYRYRWSEGVDITGCSSRCCSKWRRTFFSTWVWSQFSCFSCWISSRRYLCKCISFFTGCFGSGHPS